MLEDPQIQKLMKEVAASIMPSRQLLEVRTEPAFDAEGKEALRITLVVTDEAVRSLTGEQLTRLLVDIHDGLLREGDDRFPLVSYATSSDDGDENEED